MAWTSRRLFADWMEIAQGFDPPITLSMWFRADGTTGNGWVFHVGPQGNFKGMQMRAAYGSQKLEIRICGDLGPGASCTAWVSTTNTYALNAWSHACAIFKGPKDRTVILNGDWANRATDTTDKAIAATPDTTVNGGEARKNFGYIQGDHCEYAIWDVALSQQEIERLSGALDNMPKSPRLIRGDHLVAHDRLVRDDSEIPTFATHDIITGLQYTVNIPVPIPLSIDAHSHAAILDVC